MRANFGSKVDIIWIVNIHNIICLVRHSEWCSLINWVKSFFWNSNSLKKWNENSFELFFSVSRRWQGRKSVFDGVRLGGRLTLTAFRIRSFARRRLQADAAGDATLTQNVGVEVGMATSVFAEIMKNIFNFLKLSFWWNCKENYVK